MPSCLHPALLSRLRSLQRSTNVGFHRVATSDSGRSVRTWYRWHRTLGDRFLIVPNVTVEPLGLQHAHVFVEDARPAALVFPFAVEAAWITPDFCREVLYLHCLVPTALLGRFPKLLQSIGKASVVWSSSGWQQLLADNEALLLPMRVNGSGTDLLQRCPFILPAMMELWTYPNSLPLAWHRIHRCLGSSVNRYLRRAVRQVNGKSHITEAFHLLQKEKLLTQQVIRYHPLLAVSVEVFVLARFGLAELTKLLSSLRRVLHAVETYPTDDGYWCRLLGPHRLLDAILGLSPEERAKLAMVHFHTKRHPTPRVRFQYERLFDPKEKRWRVRR